MQFFFTSDCFLFHLFVFPFSGLVPEPPSQVQEAGEHQERPGPSGPQRPAADLLRGTHLPGGAGEKGERPAREEDAQAAGEAAEEVGGQGYPRRHRDPSKGLRDAEGQRRQDQLQQPLRSGRERRQRHGDRRRRRRRQRRRQPHRRDEAKEVLGASGQLGRRQPQEDVGLQHRKLALVLTLALLPAARSRRRLQRRRRR